MININLLPPELKLKRIEAKRNASLLSFCIILVIIFAVIGIIANAFEETVKANLDSTRDGIEINTSQLEENKNLQDLALLINDRWKTTEVINQNRVIWSQTLGELANSVPVDVQLDNLSVNSEKSPNFILQGNTTTEREIIKFKEKLENSGYFKNVNFKSSSLGQNQEEDKKLKFTLEFDLEKKGIE